MFFCLNVFQFLYLWFCLFVCLFGCYPAPVDRFAKCVCCYCKFWFFNIIFIFISHHPSSFSSFGVNSSHLVQAAWSTPVRCMGKPFKVSIHYFILFALQKVTFRFCLFFKLPLAPFNYDGKEARDVGLTCRCHLNNILPGSIFRSSMTDRGRD